jgi:hypothetical protein
MDEVMTCPYCGEEYPAGTDYCSKCFTYISLSPSEPEGQEEDGARLSVTCPQCGDIGHPGEECRQCGATFPLLQSVAQRTVSLCLPSGTRLRIPCDQEILIGRQSNVLEIKQALESFDVVSRKHCSILVTGDGSQMTVRDHGSSNHTWVGDDPVELGPNEQRRVSLPVRIRLGQRLFISIGEEGVVS